MNSRLLTVMRTVGVSRCFESERWGVALVVAFALALRFPGMLSQSYWIDEFIMVGAVPLSWSDMYHRLLFGAETHPLLYSTLLKSWALVFGYSKFALRLFSVGAGSLFVYYCHRLAGRILSRNVAFTTALIAATSPYAIYYSQEVRSYMLFALLTTASYAYFFDYIRNRSKLAYALWIIAQVAALQTHVYGVFVLVAELLYAVYHMYRRRDSALFIDELVGCLMIGLTFLPWLAVIVMSRADYLTGAASLGHQQSIGIGHFVYVPYALFFGYSLGPSVAELHQIHGLQACILAYGSTLLPAVLSVLPLLFLGVRKIWTGPNARIAIALGVGVPLAAALGVSLLTSIAFNVRFIIPILPFLLMVTAAGICEIFDRSRRMGMLIVSPFALVVTMSIYNYWTNPKYWREDYERTATFIYAQPSIAVLAGAFPETLARLVPGMKVVKLSSAELAATKPGEKRWLVWNRTWVFDGRNRLHEEAANQCRFLVEQQFAGFEVELCVKKETDPFE